MLNLLHPRLEAQLMLSKNVQLIEALQELEIHEKDVTFLSPQCQYILGEAWASSARSCDPHVVHTFVL